MQEVQDDLAKENAAIKQYKEHIKLAITEGDKDTQKILEDILKEEEEHGKMWEKKLGIE